MKTSLTEHSTCLTNHTVFQRFKQTLFICECCFLFPLQWLQFKIPQGSVCKQNNDHCQNARGYHKAKTRSSWFWVREEFILLSCCRTPAPVVFTVTRSINMTKKGRKKSNRFLLPPTDDAGLHALCSQVNQYSALNLWHSYRGKTYPQVPSDGKGFSLEPCEQAMHKSWTLIHKDRKIFFNPL